MAANIPREHIAKFIDFLNNDFAAGTYNQKVRTMIDRKQNRLIVNTDDMKTFERTFYQGFLDEPSAYMPAFQTALKNYVDGLVKTEQIKTPVYAHYHIGLEGTLKKHTPRSLSAELLRTLVCIEGILTRCSLVRPKILKSVHYCPKTGDTLTRHYSDATSDTGMPTSFSLPTMDDSGNPLSMEYGLSEYKDYQSATVQEMPEVAPAGQLPRSVDVVLENELVDKCKPGDRVQIMGIYKPLPQKEGNQARGVFRTVVVVNNIKLIEKEVHGLILTNKDINNIRAMGKDPNVFEKISSSLAPSIYGHEFIKKALLLLLLGGCEKNLENGTHLRGDINMILVGDPSTAKSQILRFVMHTAPLAISTSGRGSTGVGLTAAVISDRETGERRLEAGAMVLADRGIVCIDEFDKMSEEDRVAIHEVMEQQTVTIAKAGIHTSLNARCSVLAAANPIYGNYNRAKKPMENIGLPDSLLSRFDLLFIVLDTLDPQVDRSISEHVLAMHQTPRTDSDLNEEADGFSFGSLSNDNEEEDNTSSVMVRLPKAQQSANRFEIVSMAFVRKFLLYAKNRVHPVLGEEAAERISRAFAELRSKEDVKTLPVTARTLETMIRLATAHARCRLSPEVKLDDAEAAIEVMRYALYHETTPPVNQPPKRNMGTNQTSSDNGPDAKRRRVVGPQRQAKGVASSKDTTSTSISGPGPAAVRRSEASRKEVLVSKISNIQAKGRCSEIGLDELISQVNDGEPKPFSEQECLALLRGMDSQFAVEDGVVYFI